MLCKLETDDPDQSDLRHICVEMIGHTEGSVPQGLENMEVQIEHRCFCQFTWENVNA